MEITVQYFDGCPNWETMAERSAVIAAERSDLTVKQQLVSSQADAEALDFRGSPRLLVDGAVLFPAPDGPPGLSCRVYLTPEGLAGSPTLDQLRDAIAHTEAAAQ
ncbi:thioredoxin family protein [Microbacterium sp. MTN4-26]|uniref:thioredoxin family protein n=1 Tax=unclassified Microbacterium TaxID=2609290 RepID=UPI0036F42ED3